MIRVSRPALLLLFVLVSLPALAELEMGCRNDLFPPGHSIPACQTPPVVSPGQSFVLLGRGYPADYQVVRAYFKGERNRVEPLTLFAQGTRYSDGRVYSDRKVRPDGKFNLIVEAGKSSYIEKLEDGPHTLWVELRGLAAGRVDVHELPLEIVVRRARPWKQMGREEFSCEGPVGAPRHYSFQPLNPSMAGSIPAATCFEGGKLSFSGGPYEELAVASYSPLYVVTAAGKEIPLGSCAENAVLPDQIVRTTDCALPQNVTGRVTLRVRKTSPYASRDPGWYRDLAELNLEPRAQAAPPSAKPAPPPKRGVFRTTLVKIEVRERDFLHPVKDALYPGVWGIATIANTRYVTGRRGDFDKRCPLMLGDRALDASYLSPASGEAQLSFQVPRDLAPGSYELKIACAEEPFNVDGANYDGFEAKGERPVVVRAARPVPSGRVIARAAELTGNPAVDERRLCKPCNGDDYELELSGLDPGGDTVSEAKWTDSSLVIASNVKATGATLRLRGRIPEQGDTNPSDRHRVEVRLRDRHHQEYTLTVAPDDGRWGFNFYKSCPGFDPKSQVQIVDITRTVFPSEGGIAAKLAKLECHARVAAYLESPVFPERVRLRLSGNSETADANGNFQGTFKPSMSDIEALREPATVRVVFEALTVTGKPTGRRVSTEITLYPLFHIAVQSPPPHRPGQRIAIAWKGFKGNTSADIYFDDTKLTGRSLLLDANDPVVTVRLPEGIAGKHRLTLTDMPGNSATTTIEIEGEGSGVACSAPCVRLPPRAQQGDTIEAGIGGFAPNEQLVVRFADRFEVGTPYQQGVYFKQPIPLPRGLKDGVYRVSVTARNDPMRLAAGTLRIAGGYRAPTLKIVCPKNRPACAALGLPSYAPGESVHVTGAGWYLKGEFRADMLPRDPAGEGGGVKAKVSARAPVSDGRRPLALAQEGCVWGFADGHAVGAPCDANAGEIDKFWSLPADPVGGVYWLEMSDGLASARAEFLIEAKATSALAPAPAPAPEPKPAPGAVSYCDPDKPRLWQPGCVERPAEQRPVAPPVKCDPSRPRYAQPGCVEATDTSSPQSGAPQKCNPGIPTYAQPGCIP